MNVLDATLAVRSYRLGRALRSSALRHRRLVAEPLAVVLWRLGAEPFSAAAIGWGNRPDQLAHAVAGEPRNRDLAFAALLPFARWFNRHFEAPAARGATAPQVVVVNAATVEMLYRLGRRLAYLPTDGARPADPALVRLGRHLLFLYYRSRTPGQQLLLALTDLLNSHWATPLSQLERQSLAAVDACIEPPDGLDGFAAATLAERDAVGPLPAGEDDEKLDRLLDRFNRSRGDRTDPAVVTPLLAPIEAHYLPMTRRTWRLLWRCRERELRYPEAASVARRWEEDRLAYMAHMEWMAQSGLRRTRQTARQASMALRSLEEAQRLVEAEEACDDPLRMIPYLLEHKAVCGRVVRLDPDHKEMAERRLVKRPLVTLHSAEPCLMPVGKELWWTGQPDGREYVVQACAAAATGGTLVTLKLMTSSNTARLPTVGTDACFSIHCTDRKWLAALPTADPWTHRPAVQPAPVEPIED
jgi:hypothetical protein